MATISEFRAAFPEFGDASIYTDPMLGYWLVIAGKYVNTARWADLADHGTYLVLAHFTSLAVKARQEAEFGGQPGAAEGIVSAKSVDKVSLSFDVSSAVEENGGNWNMTQYGSQYLRAARLVGAGPVHVGTPGDAVLGGSGVYAGPYLV